MGIGQEFKSEKKFFIDEKSGREIIQLTSKCDNSHLYFTDNSFSKGDKEIYFLSNRGSKRGNVYNFFRMDLDSGIMTQVTDEPEGVKRCTKDPDSELLVYITSNKLKKFNTKTFKSETIYEENHGMDIASPFISPNKKYVGFVRNENIDGVSVGGDYSRFADTMYAIKRSWITLAYLDGSKVEDIYEDTHWVGHFQFSPDDSNIATFCHEGPWNLVQQRIWILDLVKRSAKPCARQVGDDCVGHEFWTRDGVIFFDNRRKGHDGTVTFDRKQASINNVITDQMPYIGFASKEGDVIKKIDLPYYCNHYHANNDNSLLIGDEFDYITLMDISTNEAKMEILCAHHTSWRTGGTHCHPTFGWEGDKILFLSDKEGDRNLYLVNI
jgi:oligogalacturonide lyase